MLREFDRHALRWKADELPVGSALVAVSKRGPLGVGGSILETAAELKMANFWR